MSVAIGSPNLGLPSTVHSLSPSRNSRVSGAFFGGRLWRSAKGNSARFSSSLPSRGLSGGGASGTRPRSSVSMGQLQPGGCSSCSREQLRSQYSSNREEAADSLAGNQGESCRLFPDSREDSSPF